MNIQIATVDGNGDPNIQPVWYYHDQGADKLYVITDKGSQKVKNIRRKNTVYFNVDEDAHPYRCVKGKAMARISEKISGNIPVAEKVMVKYVGSTDHPIAVRAIELVKKGESVILEITPAYYSTLTFGKQ
jgi:nitroimidazol reductase NimA-like FMN-containing flavoprotein (pyridoxamine 5'-phosphate oxidase superfamily)